MAKDSILGNSDVWGQAVPLKCHRAKDGMTQKTQPCRGAPPLTESCLLAPVFVLWLLIFPLWFQDFFVGDCNLYLTSPRAFGMDLVYPEALCLVRLKEKASTEEWAETAEKA